jgi:hypothetical protein
MCRAGKYVHCFDEVKTPRSFQNVRDDTSLTEYLGVLASALGVQLLGSASRTLWQPVMTTSVASAIETPVDDMASTSPRPMDESRIVAISQLDCKAVTTALGVGIVAFGLAIVNKSFAPIVGANG